MKGVKMMYIPLVFQFPPLREGRPKGVTGPQGPQDFNSRPCARGDYYDGSPYYINIISIPAPARGATYAGIPVIQSLLQFQFPPLREGRHGTD